MVLSFTTTAPTCLRSQVARVAATRAMFMKYSSQLARASILPPVWAGIVPQGTDAGTPPRVTWGHGPRSRPRPRLPRDLRRGGRREGREAGRPAPARPARHGGARRGGGDGAIRRPPGAPHLHRDAEGPGGALHGPEHARVPAARPRHGARRR